MLNALLLASCWVAITARLISVFLGRHYNCAWAPIVVFGGATVILLFGIIPTVKKHTSTDKNSARNDPAEELERIIKMQLAEYEKRYKHHY